ncbi:Bromo domain-containing protein [Mycena chlorophos]|uniref:Bromo domain-containing protein n=1 Tax=Mycena chlorophos TaxID=658473 RepID=A0A8H6SRF7_MYCCL|nr:Bromo domain-containing protein [Mycena chlorophos]
MASPTKKRRLDSDSAGSSSPPAKVTKLQPSKPESSSSTQPGVLRWLEPLGKSRTCLHATHLNPQAEAKSPRSTSTEQSLRVPTKLAKAANAGYSVVIITNQAALKLEREWKEKLALIVAAITEVPFRLLAATAKDKFRKPMTGMWDKVERIFAEDGVKIDKSASFFVGDFAGRIYHDSGKKKDFARTDRKRALNVGVRFFTPEVSELVSFVSPPKLNAATQEYFLVPPFELISSPLLPLKTTQELVLFIEYPCLGKSTFYRTHFSPKGYEHINQDTLGTREKCVKAVEKALKAGHSRVVDNTNRDASTRRFYLDIAKKHRVPVRAMLFTGSIDLAWRNNFYRAFCLPAVRKRELHLGLNIPFHPVAYLIGMHISTLTVPNRSTNPVDGFQIVVPTQSYPYRVPHVYTTPSSPDAARCWVPCVDNVKDKCTWEFEFVVPRYLEDVPLDDSAPPDTNPTLVVRSGELVEQVAHPYNSHKTIFLFTPPMLTSVQQIAFADGPFHMLSIPPDHFVEEGNSTQPPMNAFCLPGHESIDDIDFHSWLCDELLHFRIRLLSLWVLDLFAVDGRLTRTPSSRRSKRGMRSPTRALVSGWGSTSNQKFIRTLGSRMGSGSAGLSAAGSPSTHNNVTVAALEFYMVLMVANLIPSAPLQFKFFPVGHLYVLTVMAYDPSRTIRHVARSACQSLALLVQMGEMKVASKDSESLLIEEDGSVPANHSQSRKTELDAMIKALRKDKEVGKNEVFREMMMPLVLSPEIDHEVRWLLLKLSDLLLKPVEETPPTVKLHIPANPGPVAPSPSPVIPPAPTPKVILRAPTPASRVAPLRTPSVEPSPKVTFAIPALPPKARAAPKPRAPPAPKVNGVSHQHHAPKPAPAPRVVAPPAPLKAQAAGMSLSDLKATRVLFKKLQSNKHAKLFLRPVDPIRDNAPNYFAIVKDPMDLSTMQQKLEQGQYADRFAFREDFRLMMKNAKLYNPVATYAHNETLALETHFEKQWTIINKTLESRAKDEPKPVPVARVIAPAASTTPPAQPTPSTSKPTIKLKPPAQTGDSGGPKLSIKPPKRKPAEVKVEDTTPIEPPPPPYEDDGSHDLLQEVLAIERERDELHHRSTAPPNGKPNGKRKKPDVSTEEEEDADDALLNLIAPKKARPTPPEPSTSTGPKITLSLSKPKPSVNGAESRPSSSSSHRPSVKGKEREIVPSASASASAHVSSSRAVVPVASAAPPAAPAPAHAAATPIDVKKCKQLMNQLNKVPESALFARPVDPERDGCPTYLQEIVNPMDFGTIMESWAPFNPPLTYAYGCADAVEKVFKKQAMNNLVKEDVSWIFREPVDPVLLGIPTYFDVIRKPRDLRTIRTNLNNDKYPTVEAFEADINLMTDNAILFNGEPSEAGQLALKFQELL